MTIAVRYFQSALPDYRDLVKTSAEIRMLNFRRLLKELDADEGGKVKGPQLAAQLGITPVYVWQLKKGKRTNIDDEAARKIERHATKPRGWLDTDPDAWPFERVPREIFESLTERQKGAVEDAVMVKLYEILGGGPHVPLVPTSPDAEAIRAARAEIAAKRPATPHRPDVSKELAQLLHIHSDYHVVQGNHDRLTSDSRSKSVDPRTVSSPGFRKPASKREGQKK